MIETKPEQPSISDLIEDALDLGVVAVEAAETLKVHPPHALVNHLSSLMYQRGQLLVQLARLQDAEAMIGLALREAIPRGETRRMIVSHDFVTKLLVIEHTLGDGVLAEVVNIDTAGQMSWPEPEFDEERETEEPEQAETSRRGGLSLARLGADAS